MSVVSKNDAYEKRAIKGKSAQTAEADEITSPTDRKRKQRDMPEGWLCPGAMCFTVFSSMGFTPKQGAPGCDIDRPSKGHPSREDMRRAKAASSTGSTSKSALAPRPPGPGSNATKIPLNLDALVAQGVTISKTMNKATTVMSQEQELSEAKSHAEIIEAQLKNPYLEEDEKRALWNELKGAHGQIKAVLEKNRAQRESEASQVAEADLTASMADLGDVIDLGENDEQEPEAVFADGANEVHGSAD